MSREKIITDWFTLYSDDIYQFFIYRTGVTEAEDLVQEVYIRAIKGYNSYLGEASPKTWLLTIARNVATDEYRKQKRRKLLLLIKSKEESESTRTDTPELSFVMGEENQLLYEAIHSLKPTFRDVLILRGIKELSVPETSSILGWTENKVRSTFHRAKKALHEKLGGYDYE
ncbi:RNA polymerase sigma factor [Evansella tamaricis]|uniref:RNA polymerase sigma factor n=1 Tax=Evansella tamaricis TaxID=2069301 RepID=A0ABS6JL44_9BACI|nr:sigma-70 family RNA polymerase sigma factor [Evansella tamaricis]MBU9713135.1 sigma-70 family RNA polymerase sigma factor [Evansella tamaricis]